MILLSVVKRYLEIQVVDVEPTLQHDPEIQQPVLSKMLEATLLRPAASIFPEDQRPKASLLREAMRVAKRETNHDTPKQPILD